MGVKNETQILIRLGEEYGFSLCPFAQLLAGTKMLKQVSAFAEDSSSIGNIATSVITNEVEKMERKDVCNDSLKSSEKVKTLPTKTSVKLGSKGAATFVSDL